MLWKALSIFAALCLGGGAYFAFLNKGVHVQEKEMGVRSTKNLKDTLAEIDVISALKKKRDKEVADAEVKRDESRKKVQEIDAESSLKVREVEILKKSSEEIAKQLAQLEEQIRKTGDIRKLIAEVEKLNKEKAEAAAAAANKDQQLAFADEKIKRVQEEIIRMGEVQKRQRAGVIEPGFTARVSRPYNEFGYVILNKGNLGGMIANAMLHVKRGRYVVATLKVRDVEQTSSVADVVPGTVAQGETIRPGDLVVAAPAPPPPPATPATPTTPGAPATPTDGTAPATPPANPADPFGAPAPAPGAPMAPANADPFAPAPAPGAAPAPAAPAGMDPFAPAPPAAGAAPATPPAAPPAAPAGMDPFAPTPPKQ